MPRARAGVHRPPRGYGPPGLGHGANLAAGAPDRPVDRRENAFPGLRPAAAYARVPVPASAPTCTLAPRAGVAGPDNRWPAREKLRRQVQAAAGAWASWGRLFGRDRKSTRL